MQHLSRQKRTLYNENGIKNGDVVTNVTPQKMMYTLLTKDGHRVDVEESKITNMKTIGSFLEDIDDNMIPVDVSHDVLTDIIRYMDDHKGLSKLPLDKLKGILVASNYLDCKTLLDAGCEAFAKHLVGKSVEELREILGVTNDFTPEEEEAIRKENAWAF